MHRHLTNLVRALSLMTLALTFSNAHATALAPKTTAHYWMKLKAKDSAERTRIANLGLAIEGVIEDSVYSIGTERDLKIAKASGLLEISFQIEPQKVAGNGEKALDFPPYDSQFHNYERLTKELQKLAADYPAIVKLSSIGKSLEGRDQWLVTISADGKDLTHPAVFFMGGHHAREHVSVETPFLIAQYLASEYTKGTQRIKDLLANRTVYVVPSVNPDGSEYDIASGDYQLWRKNRRSNSDGTQGVDLNRNYGYHWGEGGASNDGDSEIYHGPSAFSEPETQNIKAFFESHNNITIDLSFHTFSELILYPWGYSNDQISDPKAFQVHKTMAETMAKWNGYTPEQSSTLYIASGDTTDWAFGAHGIISFTFELDPRMSPDMNFQPDKGFYPGQDFIKPVFEKNLEPALYLIGYSANPYSVLESQSARYGLHDGFLR